MYCMLAAVPIEMADNPGKAPKHVVGPMSVPRASQVQRPTHSLLWNGTVASNVAELKRKCADEDNAIRTRRVRSPWTHLPELCRTPHAAIKKCLGPLVEWMAGDVNAQIGAGIGRGLGRRQSTIADRATFETV